jgi:sugar lactone lactonase YvrE
MKSGLAWMGACLLLLASCSKIITHEELQKLKDELKDKTNPGIERIDFTSTNLFPEGVVYDPFNERFYVSSVTNGDIGIVTASGSYTPFITDPSLTATTGLEIDKVRKRLLVSNSPGSVGVYNIHSGERIHFINLAAIVPGAPIFINDIALDQQGNAYVTNSLSPIIYKITPDGIATVFLQEPRLALAAGQFGFNGIEYGNSGFLLVSYTNNNQVIKIPVAQPSAYSFVTLDAALNRPDGMLLSKDGKQLIVVNNAGGAAGVVLSFTTNNNWESGTLSERFFTGEVFPTTATSDGKNIYVLHAYLNKRPTGQSQFAIQRVPFEKRGPF